MPRECDDSIDEIEITAEMVEAGELALKIRWSELMQPDAELFPLVAREIFLAMAKARK